MNGFLNLWQPTVPGVKIEHNKVIVIALVFYHSCMIGGSFKIMHRSTHGNAFKNVNGFMYSLLILDPYTALTLALRMDDHRTQDASRNSQELACVQLGAWPQTPNFTFFLWASFAVQADWLVRCDPAWQKPLKWKGFHTYMGDSRLMPYCLTDLFVTASSSTTIVIQDPPHLEDHPS